MSDARGVKLHDKPEYVSYDLERIKHNYTNILMHFHGITATNMSFSVENSDLSCIFCSIFVELFFFLFFIYLN